MNAAKPKPSSAATVFPAGIIIIGGGIAGIVTAIELLAAGRRVVLVDRDVEQNLGGLAKESFGGILAVDTPIQRRHGVQDSPQRALADWSRFGDLHPGHGWPYRWAEAYVHHCRNEVYDWLRGLGLSFLPVPQWPERRGNSVPRWHVVWGTGYELTRCLVERLRSRAGPGQLELRFSQRVDRLLVEQGRVVGCAGRCEHDDVPFELRGSAVVIASGGINGSSVRVRAHWPPACGEPPADLLNGAHRFADGTLHDAVAAIGGRLSALDRMWNYAAGVRHWRPCRPDHGLSLVPPRGALWLNAVGRRFDPPLLAGQDTSEQVARISLSGGTSWQILNRRIALKELAVSGAEFNPSIRARDHLGLLRELLFGNRWLLDALVTHCQDFVVAPTLPELVHRMNALLAADAAAAGRDEVPERVGLDHVESAVRSYDAALAAGDPAADPQFANIAQARQWRGDRMRTARFLRILDPASGPLIAIHERIISRKSLGGIVTDLEARVLDQAGMPIAGLYAAGEAAGFGGGGINGSRALEGTFLGGCIFTARRAARAIIASEGKASR